MSTLKNKVQLIGNLGAAPEIRTAVNGRKMARLRLATNESYKNAKGEKVTDTQWHSLVAWGSTADIAAQFLQKGSEVMVEGKLNNREYQDKDGKTRYITEVQVSNLLMFGQK